MARGKNSRALFEVIKQSQEAQTRRVQPLRPAPRRENPLLAWFKRRSEPKRMTLPPVDPVMREITASDDHDEITVHARRISREIKREVPEDTFVPASDPMDADASSESTPSEDAAHADLVFTDHAAPETVAEGDSAESHQHASLHDTAHAMTPPVESDASLANETADTNGVADEALPTAAPRLRSSGRQVHLVLSYPSLAVAGIAMLLIMIVAFLAGRQTARPFAYTGPTLTQLQAGKTSPDVMNLDTGPTTATLSTPRESAPPPTNVAARENKEKATEAPASGELVPDRRRVVGRNYIIAQSYPDEDNAAKAAAVLQKNNIPVSIEQIDAAPGWFCVVTEVGFDRVKTDECERYQKLVRDANTQAKAARLKAFEPWLYKWK